MNNSFEFKNYAKNKMEMIINHDKDAMLTDILYSWHQHLILYLIETPSSI